MTDDPEHRSEVFGDAWALYDRASALNQELARTWNNLVGTDLFDISVHVDDDGGGRIDVYIDEFEEHRLDDLEQAAKDFIELLLLCAREATLITERCVSGAFRRQGGEHLPAFPLCGTVEEFVELVDSSSLSGLRPDQIQLLEHFQPYWNAGRDEDAHRTFGDLVEHLYQLSRAVDRNGASIVTFWAHSARPEIDAGGDTLTVVTDVETQPDGVLHNGHLVVTFRVPPGTTGVRANPNIAFDPIFNAQPWPRDPDDNMSVRCRGLLLLVEGLVCALERSVGLRRPLHDGYFRFVPLVDTDPIWAQVDPADTPDIDAALRDSDIGMATYRSDDEFIMLVQRPDGVYRRVVAVPDQLDDGVERGLAAEDASLDSASRWGLPDFVLRPETVRRGNATREVGDGTIIGGNRGLAVQVKSRPNPTGRPERERAWITKKVIEGTRQAAGSVRTIQRSAVTHTNARGREIVLDGNAVTWVGVVIIDHDSPPDGLSIPDDGAALPIVAMLRREWAFFFEQLRSTTAVVNYLHRIADAHVAPNEHVEYYYELARADEQAPAQMNPSRIPASLDDPTLRMSHPLLPMEPMGADGRYGARMYRQMLEDIATSPWDRTENDRLRVLNLLDQLPVAERTVIGQRLLTHLDRTPEVGIGETRWEARRYLLGTADIQLGFIVSNQFTDLHRQAFQQWAMLRHHEWTTLLDADVQDSASTAAVMLTPRYDRVRPWDTTVLVIAGTLDLDPNELQAMQRLWNCDRG